MKRKNYKPKSVIFLIAMYCHHIFGLTEFTSKQLYLLGKMAKRYYDIRIPKSVYDEKTRILAEHGFTDKTWEDVLQSAGHFYFAPNTEMDKCNQKLKKLFSTVTMINSAPCTYSYTRELITQSKRHGYLEIVDDSKRAYKYRIAPEYLRPIDVPELVDYDIKV